MMRLLFDGAPRTRKLPRIDAPADEPPTTPPRADVVKGLLGLRPAVGVHEMKLPAALEPDAARLLDDRRKGIGVRKPLVLRVEHEDVLRTCLLPSTCAWGVL